MTKICKSLVSNLAHMSNFHPLEVVSRGSETQLQVSFLHYFCIILKLEIASNVEKTLKSN